MTLVPKGTPAQAVPAKETQTQEEAPADAARQDQVAAAAKAAAWANQTWVNNDGSVRRRLTAKRAVAAGVDAAKYFCADGRQIRKLDVVVDGVEYCVGNAARSKRISKVVRRAELAADPEVAQRAQEKEARRKRVRRIEDGKEDRDAMREFASSSNCDELAELELTPAGMHCACNPPPTTHHPLSTTHQQRPPTTL